MSKDFYPMGFSTVTERRLGSFGSGGGVSSPFPEILTGESGWTVLPPTKENPPGVDHATKTIYVPLNGDSLAAWRIRTHEMARLAFTPTTLPKDIHPAVLDAVENFRVHNILTRSAGLPLKAPTSKDGLEVMEDSKKELLGAAQLLSTAAEMPASLRFLLTLSLQELEAGDILHAASNPNIQDLVKFCYEFLWLEGEKSLYDFNTTERLAALIQHVFPLMDDPKAQKLNLAALLRELLKGQYESERSEGQQAAQDDDGEPCEGEGDEWLPGERADDGERGRETKGKQQPRKDWGGKWQSYETPRWLENFTSRLPSFGAWGKLFGSLPPINRGYKYLTEHYSSEDLTKYYKSQKTGRDMATGPKGTAKPQKTSNRVDASKRPPDSSLRWGKMKIVTPALTQLSSPKVIAERLTRKRHTEMGAVPRAMHRLPVDQKIFTTIKRNPAPCSILMDCSGSMAVSAEILRKLLDKAPRATIARYNGGGENGKLIILARDGRRVQDSEIGGGGSGNVVDGPALKWLAQQPGPRYWISDGCVTGIGDRESNENALDCWYECMTANIYQTYSVDQFLEVIDKKIPLPPLNIFGIEGEYER